MKKNVSKVLFWTPRAIIILFALFLAIFSLDVFDSAFGLGEILIALLMHNLPSLVLLAILLASWRHDFVGAAVFLIFGLACVGLLIALQMSSDGATNPIMVIGSIVFFFTGIIFLVSWLMNKKPAQDSA